MVNPEARKQINTANRLSAFHLRDGLTRIQFVQEIKSVIDKQFAAARQAKCDEECLACVKNLRSEIENPKEQGRLLRNKTANLYAKVAFVRESNKIVGYMISSVHVVLSGFAVVGGALMIPKMTPVGVLAGAVLVVDGLNGLSKELIANLSDVQTEGMFADGAMQAAELRDLKQNQDWLFIIRSRLLPVFTAFGGWRKNLVHGGYSDGCPVITSVKLTP